jgi:NAD(P)-dependent dehydrogenase (short-subunit alcohol dehydrogenase family)
MTLGGKVVLVTGAASGIGRATAQKAASSGAKVILTDRNDAGGNAVRDGIRGAGGDALYLHQDVTLEGDWSAVFDVIRRDYRRLDVLVNNAGIAWAGSILDMTLADWQRQNAVNLDGVFLGTRFAIALMVETGGGAIVNLSSVAGLKGSPRLAGYSATKGGVRLFTKSVALECARNGWPIRVNSVHPGIIATAIWETVIPGALREGANAIDPAQIAAESAPGGIAGAAEQVADGILFLASEASSYVNGAELVIDAGLSA